MIIFPAIDLLGGKCVRLKQGVAVSSTVYSDDPVKTARQFESEGAKFLHIVDLDAAFSNAKENTEIIKSMAKTVSIPIQTGGGIRSMEKLRYLLEECGVSRVILGTAAVENPKFLEEAAGLYKSRIVAGIDAVKGKAAVKGWTKETSISAIDLAKQMKSCGVETVVYTDIKKDGMLLGPNLMEIKEMIQKSQMSVIASGGISSIEDLLEVKKLGAAGAIIGKSFYEKKLSLKAALKAVL